MALRRKYEPGKDRVLAIDPRAIGSEFDQGEDASSETKSKIACIRIFGPLEQRASFWGPGYDTILACFREAIASPEIGAVLLHIDSPGGDAAGNIECARAMIEAKRASKKPVVAFADEQAYSAAYALACVADEIFLPETGGVGSVGCLCVAADVTKMVKDQGVNAVVVRSGARKAEGHPLIPLNDETLARFQERVDGLATSFAQLVSDSRGVSVRKLLSLEGACFYGEDALRVKLADGIMSLDDVISGLSLRISESVPLDGTAQPVSTHSRGSKDTLQEENSMTLTELYAALAAAKAAGDTAKVASLNAQIASKKAEEESEEDSSEEDSEDESSGDEESNDDDDDDDDDDKDEPEEEEEETKKSVTTKTYRRSKKSEAVAAAVEEIFPGLSAAQVRGRLMALKDGQGRVEKLEKQVKAVKTQQRNEEARKLVAQGVKAGKIPPSQKEFWLAQASKKDGLASLREYLKTAVPVVTGTESPGLAPGYNIPGPGGLTPEEQEICTRMGVSSTEFMATKAKMGAPVANMTGPTQTGFTIERPFLPTQGSN